jgi:hypothetical protein
MRFLTSWTVLRGCALLWPMLLASAATLAAPPGMVVSAAPAVAASVISLVPAPRAVDATIIKGEPSYARAPANFHVFASVRAGEATAPEVLTLRFAAPTQLVSIQSTKDFAVQEGGSCAAGIAYAAGASCTVLVEFTPQAAGSRRGTLTVANTAETQASSIGLLGYGYAPVLSFTPALISTVPGTYSASRGLLLGAQNLTVDGGDVLYIADIGNNLVREIDSSGSITNISPFFVTPNSVAVDNYGDIYGPATVTSENTYFFVYYSPGTEQTGWYTTYAAGTCTVSDPCSLGSVGMNRPAQIGIDADDNLFMEETTKGALEMPVGNVAGAGLEGVTLDLWYLTDAFAYYTGPASTFAVDADDNIYTAVGSSAYEDCTIVAEPDYEAEGSTPAYTRVAGAAQCGFSGDGGQARDAEIGATVGQIAFDVAGNLYFSDTDNQRVRRIDASTGIIRTIAGTGTAGYTGDGIGAISAELSSPTGVAVDSQGQVYIISSAAIGQVVRKLGPDGYVALGAVTVGSSSTAHVLTVSNTGNASLQFTNAVFTGTNPGNFKIDPDTTSCLLTAGSVLDAGQSCTVGIIFTPSASGKRFANLVFNDNTVTNSNTVQLIGTGTTAPALAITSPVAAASLRSGATITFAAAVTSTSSPVPTGKVSFSLDGKAIGSPVALSSAGASMSTQATVGTHTLSATYGGDAHYSEAGPVTRTFSVVGASGSPASTQ